MDPEAARLLVLGIAAVGGVVWFTAWQFHRRTFGRPRATAGNAQLPLDEQPEDWIIGSAELPGEPERLAGQAAATLAAGGSQHLPPLRIVDVSEGRVAFEGGGDRADAKPTAYIISGELRFTAIGAEKTAVDYAVVVGSSRGLKIGSAIFLSLGLVALVGGTWAMLAFVASNPNPEVRWQSFQMFQIIHVLWPPFLFAGIDRVRRRAVRSTMDTLVHNLPYLETRA